MKKLSKVKKWFTVENAAKIASHFLEETVEDSDLLQLTLDGQLPISVYLPNTIKAQSAVEVPKEEAKVIAILHHPLLTTDKSFSFHLGFHVNGQYKKLVDSSARELLEQVLLNQFNIPSNEKAKLDETIAEILAHEHKIEVSISFVCILNPENNNIIQTQVGPLDRLQGTYRFPMIGSNRLDIKDAMLRKFKHPYGVTDVTLDGNWVISPNGTWFQLADFDWRDEIDELDTPIPQGLPEDALFVYERDALMKFLSSIDETEETPPSVITKDLATKTKNKLVLTCRALALCIVEELDDTPTASQLKALKDAMQYHHNDIPCSDPTLREYLTNPN